MEQIANRKYVKHSNTMRLLFYLHEIQSSRI